jgi:hypothetical protein
VRLDGVVKVLDFGLAKIGAGEVIGQAPSQSPTETVVARRPASSSGLYESGAGARPAHGSANGRRGLRLCPL